MIITIFRYEKYFGSQSQIKTTHEIFLSLRKTHFCQKNPKKVVNMSQIDNSSLWIEKPCLRTCFKTSSFSSKNMRSKNIFKFSYFCGVPNQKVESPINEWSGVPNQGVESLKTENRESLMNSPQKNKHDYSRWFW